MLALRRIKEAGLETYVSIEPWIPEVTDPRAIIERTRRFVDFYILGSFNYAGVEGSYYREQLPPLLEWLEGENIPFFVKKELLDKSGVAIERGLS
jgi:DNA repair photolyase